MFLQLLVEMGHYLEVLGGAIGYGEREKHWGPFLLVLKGLHFIAKLYEGAMEDLMSVLSKVDETMLSTC